MTTHTLDDEKIPSGVGRGWSSTRIRTPVRVPYYTTDNRTLRGPKTWIGARRLEFETKNAGTYYSTVQGYTSTTARVTTAHLEKIHT